MSKTILLTAGGTGGHLFPAQALAGELGRRGWTVDLATDERADKYGGSFPARDVHIIASETVRGRSPIALIKTVVSLLRGTFQAAGVIKRIKPSAVVGFGGYPTFPPMLGARLASVPSVLHEANGVMGRANKMLAGGVTAIATSAPLHGVPDNLAKKCVMTGNPVRDAVIEAAGQDYAAPAENEPFNLLVFGGSQGARFFSDALPEAIAALPEDLKARLRLVQQCRPEDMERVKAAYDKIGIQADLQSFFTDMPARIADAHLVIGRAGASTIGELTVIGRPSILVPLPNALDQDQKVNAEALGAAGGAWPLAQKDATPERLANEIEGLMRAPDRLGVAAVMAKQQGLPDAVARLADLVERVAEGQKTFEGAAS